MSDYKMVPVVATGDMRIAGAEVDKRLSVLKAADVYEAMLAKAPPFVVTDEMVEKVALAVHGKDFAWDWDDLNNDEREHYRNLARAAIEAVLGGGK